MKRIIMLLTLVAGLAILNSCKKEDNKASLELFLKDNLGNAVTGASVKLYASQTDWANKTNQVGPTQFSDVSGKTKFTGLSSIKYYWFAEKDCQNNVNDSISTNTPLSSDATNNANVILESTGTLKFNNTSASPYRIFINGTAVFDMPGGTIKYKYSAPTGSYSLRVLQLSGYLVTADDQTFPVTLNCGDTATTTFP